jgi:uncharacterized repeat protein (TIGR03943 family)
MGLPARPLRAAILIVWAGFFVALWFGGDADRYLGPRTTWVVPFGAITLSLAAIGYGLLTLRDLGDGSRKRLTTLESASYFALLIPILAVFIAPRAELGAQAARKKSTNANLAAVELGKDRKAAAQAAASAAATNDQVADIDFLSLASVTTDPGYAKDIGVKPGTRVRFLGFTVRTGKHDRFQLARFLISCCAADAVPVFVEVKAMGNEIPADNAWVDVAGRLEQHKGKLIVEAESITPAEQPDEPYLTFWGE